MRIVISRTVAFRKAMLLVAVLAVSMATSTMSSANAAEASQDEPTIPIPPTPSVNLESPPELSSPPRTERPARPIPNERLFERPTYQPRNYVPYENKFMAENQRFQQQLRSIEEFQRQSSRNSSNNTAGHVLLIKLAIFAAIIVFALLRAVVKGIGRLVKSNPNG